MEPFLFSFFLFPSCMALRNGWLMAGAGAGGGWRGDPRILEIRSVLTCVLSPSADLMSAECSLVEELLITAAQGSTLSAQHPEPIS